MTRDEIFEGVRICIADALDVALTEITEDRKLVDDLGADSLDMLDILFQLEQRFGIKLSMRHIEKKTSEALSGAPIEINGVYTNEAMQAIRKAMPEVPLEELPDGLPTRNLPMSFRVATFINLVEHTLEENNG